MEQPQTLPRVAPLQLAGRVRNYQPDALAELFELSFDDAYELAFALTGDHDTAGEVLERAFLKVSDRLPDYQGDSATLPAWVQAAVEDQVRALPRQHFAGRGVREALARLGHAEHEAVSLRLISELEPAMIAAATGRRYASVLGAEMAGLRTMRVGAGPGLGLALPAAQRQLDAAIHHLLEGADPAEAARWAPAVSDAHALLAAAAGVAGLPREAAPPAVRARIRSHFVAAGNERRATWVHRHSAPAAVPGHRPRQHHGLTAAALVLACLIAIGAGVMLAGAAALSSPSSAAYPLKRAGEDILLSLTVDRVARADLEVKLGQERVKEAETEAALKHGDAAVDAEQAHFDELRAAAVDLAAVRHRDAKWKGIRDRLEAQASQPSDQLQRMLASNGMKAQAEQVAGANQRFQADRQTFDKALGVPPPATTPGTQPSGVPTAPPPGG